MKLLSVLSVFFVVQGEKFIYFFLLSFIFLFSSSSLHPPLFITFIPLFFFLPHFHSLTLTLSLSLSHSHSLTVFRYFLTSIGTFYFIYLLLLIKFSEKDNNNSRPHRVNKKEVKK